MVNKKLIIDQEVLDYFGDNYNLIINQINNNPNFLKQNSLKIVKTKLTISDRLRLAELTYNNFDILDFGIPAKVTHKLINQYYPVDTHSEKLIKI